MAEGGDERPILYKAAVSAGILRCTDAPRKEFVSITVWNPWSFGRRFEGEGTQLLQDKEFLAEVIYANTVRRRSNFIDCVNWVHEQRYVKFEECCLSSSSGHRDYLAQLFFSRLVVNGEEEDELESCACSVMHEVNSAFEPREFAALFRWDPDERMPSDRQSSYVVADDGEDPVVRRLRRVFGPGKDVTIRSHRIPKEKNLLMDWLQTEGYRKNETQLQSLYYDLFDRLAASYPSGTPAKLEQGHLTLSLWSRTRRGRIEE